jgi:hemerythrin-like domain-containing protein
MGVELFRSQHVKLLDLVGQLGKQLGPDAGARAAGIKDLLNKLGGVIATHLAAEDNALYPRLVADARPQVASVAKRFQQEMGGLKQAFADYATRWSRAAIAERASVFVQETQGLIQALASRIEREERELYALIDS